MRQVDIHPTVPVSFSEEQIQKLEQWLSIEIEDAIGIRKVIENHWRDLLRMYESVPKNPTRNFPVENAPNYEVALGAIAVDALYAQVIDLIFSITPLITCRPVPHKRDDKETEMTAKAMQRWVNWMVANELGLRECADDGILNCIKLGTEVFYIPWIENVKKTKTAKVLSSHPQMFAIPPEDCITPMGANFTSIQNLRWFGMRTWPSSTELRQRAKRNGWDLGEDENKVKRIGTKDWVKNRREALGRQFEGMRIRSDIYEIIDLYLYYDIDDDGLDEDLYVVYDRVAKKVLYVSYNPFDTRPFSDGRYQKREHLFWGMGVLEMVKSMEEGASDFFNYWVLNAMQANTKDIVAKAGVFPDNWTRWPGKLTSIDGDPSTDFKEVSMHSTDASLPQAIAMTISFCERRVGLNDMNTPRPSQVLGSRTPGITAMTLLQQVNKRFTPAFDSMKFAKTEGIKQGVYRYSEKLKEGGKKAEDIQAHIMEVLGFEDGARVLGLMKKESFADEVDIELTASTASVNREADRQNAVILMNILAQYYTRTMELVMVAANPQVSEEVRAVAGKIASATGEIIDRTLRTFDSTRDPQAFIISVEEEINSLNDAAMNQQAMAGLMNVLTGGGNGVGAPNAGGMAGQGPQATAPTIAPKQLEGGGV